jgi:hypothetical protein
MYRSLLRHYPHSLPGYVCTRCRHQFLTAASQQQQQQRISRRAYSTHDDDDEAQSFFENLNSINDEYGERKKPKKEEQPKEEPVVTKPQPKVKRRERLKRGLNLDSLKRQLESKTPQASLGDDVLPRKAMARAPSRPARAVEAKEVVPEDGMTLAEAEEMVRQMDEALPPTHQAGFLTSAEREAETPAQRRARVVVSSAEEGDEAALEPIGELDEDGRERKDFELLVAEFHKAPTRVKLAEDDVKRDGTGDFGDVGHEVLGYEEDHVWLEPPTRREMPDWGSQDLPARERPTLERATIIPVSRQAAVLEEEDDAASEAPRRRGPPDFGLPGRPATELSTSRQAALPDENSATAAASATQRRYDFSSSRPQNLSNTLRQRKNQPSWGAQAVPAPAASIRETTKQAASVPGERLVEAASPPSPTPESTEDADYTRFRITKLTKKTARLRAQGIEKDDPRFTRVRHELYQLVLPRLKPLLEQLESTEGETERVRSLRADIASKERILAVEVDSGEQTHQDLPEGEESPNNAAADLFAEQQDDRKIRDGVAAIGLRIGEINLRLTRLRQRRAGRNNPRRRALILKKHRLEMVSKKVLLAQAVRKHGFDSVQAKALRAKLKSLKATHALIQPKRPASEAEEAKQEEDEEDPLFALSEEEPDQWLHDAAAGPSAEETGQALSNRHAASRNAELAANRAMVVDINRRLGRLKAQGVPPNDTRRRELVYQKYGAELVSLNILLKRAEEISGTDSERTRLRTRIQSLEAIRPLYRPDGVTGEGAKEEEKDVKPFQVAATERGTQPDELTQLNETQQERASPGDKSVDAESAPPAAATDIMEDGQVERPQPEIKLEIARLKAAGVPADDPTLRRLQLAKFRRQIPQMKTALPGIEETYGVDSERAKRVRVGLDGRQSLVREGEQGVEREGETSQHGEGLGSEAASSAAAAVSEEEPGQRAQWEIQADIERLQSQGVAEGDPALRRLQNENRKARLPQLRAELKRTEMWEGGESRRARRQRRRIKFWESLLKAEEQGKETGQRDEDVGSEAAASEGKSGQRTQHEIDVEISRLRAAGVGEKDPYIRQLQMEVRKMHLRGIRDRLRFEEEEHGVDFDEAKILRGHLRVTEAFVREVEQEGVEREGKADQRDGRRRTEVEIDRDIRRLRTQGVPRNHPRMRHLRMERFACHLPALKAKLAQHEKEGQVDTEVIAKLRLQIEAMEPFSRRLEPEEAKVSHTTASKPGQDDYEVGPGKTARRPDIGAGLQAKGIVADFEALKTQLASSVPSAGKEGAVTSSKKATKGKRELEAHQAGKKSDDGPVVLEDANQDKRLTKRERSKSLPFDMTEAPLVRTFHLESTWVPSVRNPMTSKNSVSERMRNQLAAEHMQAKPDQTVARNGQELNDDDHPKNAPSSAATVRDTPESDAFDRLAKLHERKPSSSDAPAAALAGLSIAEVMRPSSSSLVGTASSQQLEDAQLPDPEEVQQRPTHAKTLRRQAEQQPPAQSSQSATEVEQPSMSSVRPPAIKSLIAKDLAVQTLDIPDQPAVPPVQHGLDRVLFNPGVYQLQDPHSRVYNFDPYLQKITPIADFDFTSLKEYKTSSQDELLSALAKEHGKKFVGSTSSMTGTLAHFHYLLSNWRSLNLSMLSRGFPETLDTFTQINRAPNAIFLRYKGNGTYAIDADKEWDSPNVLMMLGKSMEKLLTLPKEEYERHLVGSENPITEEEKEQPESYEYTGMGRLLMRSQLDAHDRRLPGTGMFDLKTRAVVSIRMDASNFEPMLGYEIHTLQGRFESYEREFYDMMRSTMLKYLLQARMGRMDGIFLAYHNVQRIFGFQYLPIMEMDRAIHGQVHPCLGEQEFRVSLRMMEEVLEMATERLCGEDDGPGSLRFVFETVEKPTTMMWVFAERVPESEIERIQSRGKWKVEEFERRVLGLEERRENPFSIPKDAEEKREDEKLAPTLGHHRDLRQESVDKQKTRPLFTATIIHRSFVNCEACPTNRPEHLKPHDEWRVEYILKEAQMSDEAKWARYEDAKARRRKVFEKLGGESEDGDVAREAEVDGEEAKAEGEKGKGRKDGYLRILHQLAEKGREFRKKVEVLEQGREKVVFGSSTPMGIAAGLQRGSDEAERQRLAELEAGVQDDAAALAVEEEVKEEETEEGKNEEELEGEEQAGRDEVAM